jgi:hypothetical protein
MKYIHFMYPPLTIENSLPPQQQHGHIIGLGLVLDESVQINFDSLHGALGGSSV